jgi:uracil-DNA glycosylase family 4
LSEFENLVRKISQCALCEDALPHTPRPIFSLHNKSKILIIGQAPGLKAHKSGKPFTDTSGDRLRLWMGLTTSDFYNPEKIGILPMGLCFPGYINNADAPPRKECAPTWHNQVLTHLKPRLTLYVGRYAQQYYLKKHRTLTDAVKHAEPHCIALPHPSGRNNRWLAKNPWFEAQVLPRLRKSVEEALTP